MSKESIGGWIVLVIPVLLAILHGLQKYKEELITEGTMTCSTICAAILFCAGVCMYAPTGRYPLLYGLFGFAVIALVCEELFKAVGDIARKYRKTNK